MDVWHVRMVGKIVNFCRHRYYSPYIKKLTKTISEVVVSPRKVGKYSFLILHVPFPYGYFSTFVMKYFIFFIVSGDWRICCLA